MQTCSHNGNSYDMTFQVLKICDFVTGCTFSSLLAKTSQGLTNMVLPETDICWWSVLTEYFLSINNK
jgi:hypothetical protein